MMWLLELSVGFVGLGVLAVYAFFLVGGFGLFMIACHDHEYFMMLFAASVMLITLGTGGIILYCLLVS